MALVLFLDDDHVLKLMRFAMAGPSQVPETWVRAFFSPEPSDPEQVYGRGAGLHPEDGVVVLGEGTRVYDSPAEVEILITRRGPVTSTVLEHFPKLRLIQRLGERAEGIDLGAAAARGVAVSCLPRRSLIYTAEHSILMMLALSKRLLEADSAVRTGAWDRSVTPPADRVSYNWVGLSGLSGLFGRRLGIIGLGEVGTIVARLSRALGMEVVYANRTRFTPEREECLGVRFASREKLLASSDFVSVNASNLPQNRGMIDAGVLASMKPGAFLINTSRGALVDDDALYGALTSGHLGGAGLDVHAQEPRLPEDRFCRLPNVVLTPHIAGGSRLGLLDELGDMLDNCRAALRGDPVRCRVESPDARR